MKVAAGTPRTVAWEKGVEVRGYPHIAPGTIATFEADGTYTNESGNHAAIYLYQDDRASGYTTSGRVGPCTSA